MILVSPSIEGVVTSICGATGNWQGEEEEYDMYMKVQVGAYVLE